MSATPSELSSQCQRLQASNLNKDTSARVMAVLNNSSSLSPAIKNKYVIIYVVAGPPLDHNASSPYGSVIVYV